MESKSNGRAIYWRSSVGCFFVLLNLWIYINQHVAGDMKRIRPGGTPAPEWMKNAVVWDDAFWAVIIVLTLIFVVVRPWVKDGEPSFAGLLCLAMASCVWQDPLLAYDSIVVSYNTLWYNVGGWACHIRAYCCFRGSVS
jgi:hypothetical protein